MTENIMQTADLLEQAIDNLKACKRAFTAEASKYIEFSTPNGTYNLAAQNVQRAVESLSRIEPLIAGLGEGLLAEMERTHG